jgi:hypothetical protein
MRRDRFIACTLLFCLCVPSMAQQQSNPAVAAAAPDAGKMSIRSYDVSDLLRPSRDYPYDSAVIPPTELSSETDFTGFVSEQRVVTRERQDLLDATALIDLVLAMVDPNSWDGWRPAPKQVVIPAAARRGGGGGGGDPGLFAGQQNPLQAQPDVAGGADKARLRMLGTALVVLQTDENHKRIAELLTQLRKEAGPLRIVTVRADWLLLDPADADGIVKRKAGDAKSGAVHEVDLAAFEKLAGQSVRYRGLTTCFNGQTTHVASGRARTVVHDLEAVTGEGVGLYSPRVALIHAGAILQVTPLLAADGATALVDVQSVVSESGNTNATTEMPRPATTLPLDPSRNTIDKLDMIVHQLKTSLRLPTNKPFLIGGMTLEPSTTSDGKQLYLVLEVSSPRG